MKLQLKPFQTDAVSDLHEKADLARMAVGMGMNSALVLSAPTGAGKTVIAAELLERLIGGYEAKAPDEDTTILWLTDQPELNEQTLRKIADYSDAFDPDALITIDAATFNQKVLDPGCVYFLNTQKLAVTSKLVTKSDKRPLTIWQVIANTVAARPKSFWLVLDEAHRGMQRSQADQELAETIPQKFILGSPEDGLPAMPLIFGISATPDRFTKLLSIQPERTQYTVVIEPEDVRSSGLLKQSISLFHVDEKQPGAITLLGAAAQRLLDFEDQWAHYAAAEKSPQVSPVLVVQVDDGTKKQVTKTALADALDKIESVLGPLDGSQVAHSFQEHETILIDGARPLNYVKPSDIEGSPDLRVVFFKQSLTTGWDCPRAEVMMSFRTAQEEVYITQLVGRLVRTPLARAVSGSDLLNSVSLYLPEYDTKTVKKVIKRLTDDDPDNGVAGTDVQVGNVRETLTRASGTEALFKAAENILMERVERIPKTSEVRRLFKLARRLAWDDIDKQAKPTWERDLLDVLHAERAKRAKTKSFKAQLEEAAKITAREHIFDVGAEEASEEKTTSFVADIRNISQAFDEAGRKLGEGLHKAYLKDRAAKDPKLAPSDIKLELFVLAQDDDVREAVEKRAEELCDQGLDVYDTQISAQPDDKRQEYRRIGRQGSEPRAEPWEAPSSIEGSSTGPSYPKHVFVAKNGDFHFSGKPTGLEEKVLDEELAKDEVLGFLRNEPRKQWAFSVGYRRFTGLKDNEYKNMYPDFLLFRRQGSKIVVDLLEPHSLSQSDSVAKAQGLARFAKKHGSKFGRIEMLDDSEGPLKCLNLKDPKTRNLVLETSSEAGLKLLFEPT